MSGHVDAGQTTMSEDQLKELLGQLQQRLDQTKQLDPEAREMVAALEHDIHRLLDKGDEEMDFDTFQEGAQSLEARFSAEHPMAEQLLREVIDILAKVGL